MKNLNNNYRVIYENLILLLAFFNPWKTLVIFNKEAYRQKICLVFIELIFLVPIFYDSTRSIDVVLDQYNEKKTILLLQ